MKVVSVPKYLEGGHNGCVAVAFNVLGYDGNAILKKYATTKRSGVCLSILSKLIAELGTPNNLHHDYMFKKRQRWGNKRVKNFETPLTTGILFTTNHVSAVIDGVIYDNTRNILNKKAFVFVEVPLNKEKVVISKRRIQKPTEIFRQPNNKKPVLTLEKLAQLAKER